MTNEEICVWLKAEAEPKFQKFTSGLIPDHRCAYPKAAHSCKKDC